MLNDGEDDGRLKGSVCCGYIVGLDMEVGLEVGYGEVLSSVEGLDGCKALEAGSTGGVSMVRLACCRFRIGLPQKALDHAMECIAWSFRYGLVYLELKLHEGAINQCNTASDRPENTSGSDIEASAPASHGLAFTPEQHQALLALLQGSSHLQSLTINQLTSQPNNLESATLKSNRKKLDSRSRKCINLGHKPGVKGHLLFDLHNKELFISRDVVFFESHFPYKHNPSMPSSSAHTNTHLDDLFDDVFLPNPVPNPTFNHSVDNGHTEYNSHSADSNSNETNHPTHSPTNETNHLHSGNCEPIPVRRSHRQVHPPNYLKDYHCNLLHHPDSAVASSSTTCSG
ncbi:hypothetical protein KIW84_073533 [Lathyrus oleraceus]|uniref:Retroviral polymerase SH3-like domain-containing protein n=1 Tax=Pisum sativum TaxID=3888 RepID=A0A9D4VP49_PEA|nr:hypothetical protein KIW84_073533 [Pisum sativum]